MTIKIKYSVSITICLFFVLLGYCQTDSLKQSDSLNTSLLKEYDNKLKLIEQQRIRDSIKKSELELQLSQLKTTDNLKKEELQNQLQEISNKEKKRIAEKKAKIDSLRVSAKSFHVIGFFNDTLFPIYNKLGSFTAHDRALAISKRIKKLKNDYSFSYKTLKVVEAESTFDIVYGESIIMSISENDALWNNTSKKNLAEKYCKIVTDAVLKYKQETNLTTLLKEISLALLVLTILIILLYFVGKLFKWTKDIIKTQEGKRINGLKIRDYTLLDSSKQVVFFTSLNTILKWIIIIILIYIALPIIFGFFPWTQTFAQTLFGYIFNPLKKIGSGLWNYLPNLFTIIVIFFVFRYALKGIHFLKNEIEQGKLHLSGFYPDWANPTFQIIRVILYAFMFVLIFPYLPGSDSPIFQGVSVFLGFLFTFGSAGSLSNIMAGIILTYMRLFKIGDRVKIGDVVGDVIEKSLLVTRVRTIKNEIISIPNSTVMSSHTTNYSNEAEMGSGLIIHSTITIGYDIPWKDIHQALVNAAGRTDLLLKNPKPFVLQTSLDDFYISYQINAYTKDANKQATIYSQLHQNIQDCCNEVGIEILSPHYRAARDGNMITIPAKYLNKDYKAPSFNIKIDKEEKK
ncbi:MAG: mechanosensitive ion channel family protein [Vicingaceae bacterium]|jgi:small-conductance mechanosensitive channel|nr:mechanosensitive ion channel family protein [Flavobacteriales bacterium]MDF1674420.1 mechanosensitive ion channel family protein [Vicingaceae bacterium]